MDFHPMFGGQPTTTTHRLPWQTVSITRLVLAFLAMAFRDLMGSAVVAAVVAAGTTYALHRSVLQKEGIEVPSVLGLPAQSARALIESRGLMFVVGEEREDAKTAPGNIVAQKPLEGSRIERGQSVDVVVAKPPAPVKVPALVGMALSDGKMRLETMKLVVGKVTEDNSAEVKPGSIAAQSLSEGSEVKVGSVIDLVVSKGVGTLPVPGVVGRSLTKAKEELKKAGFNVGNIRYRSDDDHSEGVILEQNPAANQPAAKGASVDLVINRD
jgi:eukaryotic-like serine/threonine-protein kinase